MCVAGLPTVIEAVAVGVLEPGVRAELSLVDVGQTVPVWVTQRAVVRVGECLVLLAGLLLSVDVVDLDRVALNLSKADSEGNTGLARVQWVKAVLYLPTIREAIAIGVIFLPVSAI